MEKAKPFIVSFCIIAILAWVVTSWDLKSENSQYKELKDRLEVNLVNNFFEFKNSLEAMSTNEFKSSLEPLLTNDIKIQNIIFVLSTDTSNSLQSLRLLLSNNDLSEGEIEVLLSMQSVFRYTEDFLFRSFHLLNSKEGKSFRKNSCPGKRLIQSGDDVINELNRLKVLIDSVEERPESMTPSVFNRIMDEWDLELADELNCELL